MGTLSPGPLAISADVADILIVEDEDSLLQTLRLAPDSRSF